jgi:NAD(P)-dependent dehydrogenase (short-subunit alcohol dehydrogenase family)
LTRELAVDLASCSVTVYAIAAGFIETDMSEAVRNKAVDYIRIPIRPASCMPRRLDRRHPRVIALLDSIRSRGQSFLGRASRPARPLVGQAGRYSISPMEATDDRHIWLHLSRLDVERKWNCNFGTFT